ncbi:hypothetical protein [Polymorphospora lycopeni]|uniref:Uncharacterized protein n=1 Tax=Polymorphospora lycopeni TaxID=3140240 RepID=A0ABV5CKW1_9ACTN
MAERERCRPLVDDNGQVVASVRGSGELPEEARRALLNVVEAAKRLQAEQDAADPSRIVRWEEGQQRIRERVARWRREDGDW